MNEHPALLIVAGQKKAELIQRFFVSTDMIVLPFESAKFFPIRLRCALVDMPSFRDITGHRRDKLEGWLNEFVRPRLPMKADGETREDVIYLMDDK